jgi:osmotically-inducible protein OsmY
MRSQRGITVTDWELQRRVEEALEYEPSFYVADVRVSVERGVVTLRGDMRTYEAKSAAERAALSVNGVTAVANQISNRWLTLKRNVDRL